MNNTACVVIPVYKKNPSDWEKASFRQVFKVLCNYDIYIYTYPDIDLSVYYNIAKSLNKEFGIEYFDKEFFTSIQSYNRLCLSVEFYKRFFSYEYMLIYQLDAWVFRDELNFWCSKGYDYIGAPWFTDFGAHGDSGELWAVGNGGFSLRRNSFYIKMLQYKWPVTFNIEFKRGGWNFLKSILKSLGVRNTVKYYLKNARVNEDWLLSNFFSFTKRKCLNPYMPTPLQAAGFSFEQQPLHLYKLCGNKLPFGCHAFEKYEYETFWKKFIVL